MTLNEIAYNIHNIMYPNTLTLEGELPLSQIKHWIHYHRAKLIEENISKGILAHDNLYQNLSFTDAMPVLSSSYYNDFYGREIARTQNRGDFRNLGVININIPEIIMLPNEAAIKEVNVDRYIYDITNETFNEGSAIIPISSKSRSEKHFGGFNKFTNNNKPFYVIEREREISSNINNGGLKMKILGLQISPNNLGDLKTPAAENLEWRYKPRLHMILQDPTQMFHNLGETDSSSVNYDPSSIIDDDSTPYPIPAQYVRDLIERIVQLEASTVLKIMENES